VKERPLDPPDRYHSSNRGEARAAKSKPAREWWKIFGDRALDRLIDHALKNSLDLEATCAKVDLARASLILAGAGWYPSVSARGDVSVSESDMGVGLGSTRRESYSLSLSAAYEVDLWGKVRYGREAAKQDLAASEDDLLAARISVAAQISDAYFLAVELRSQLQLLQRTIDNRRVQLELVRRRYRMGVVTALDIYQAEESLSRALAQHTTFGGRLRTTEHAISVLAGEFPGRSISGKLDKLPRRVRLLPAGLPTQLLLRRPDLRAAHARLTAADARVGRAVAGHYPSLSISASIGGSFDPVSLLWNVLGNLTAPIFQGMRVQAQVNQKKALLRQQLALYKVTLLAALKDVEDALITGQMVERRVVHLESRVKAAEGARRLSMEQYTQGLVPYLTVLTAERSVYTARSELISARRELISARIQLARALGGGWQEVSHAG